MTATIPLRKTAYKKGCFSFMLLPFF